MPPAAPWHPTRKLMFLLTLPLLVAGCGGVPHNASLYSPHQPEVSHTSLTLDLPAGSEGLAPDQTERLSKWFAAIGLRYGDHVALASPLGTPSPRAAVADVAARFGITLDESDANLAAGTPPGSLRVTVRRASAHVSHCPDWSGNAASNPADATSTNYGCATNSNLAAMVANPEDLLHGATATGHTEPMSAEKAISAWRAAPPSAPGTAKDSSTRQ